MKYCVYCGMEQDDDAIFCTACGKRIEEEVETTPAPVVEPAVETKVEPKVAPAVAPAAVAKPAPAPAPVKNELRVKVTLTEQEALNGVQKKLALSGLEKPVQVSFPSNIKEGTMLALRNLSFVEENGQIVQKDVYVKICVK